MATYISNPLVVEFVHPGPATLDFTPTRPLRVFDARLRVTTFAGGTTPTCQIRNVAANITNAISAGADTAGLVGRAGTIDDATYLVPAGGTLRSVWTGAATAGLSYVYCYTS